MAKVENPYFDAIEVSCEDCPFDNVSYVNGCRNWWYRNGNDDNTILECPTEETYEEACKLAEEHSVKLEPIS